MKQILVVVFVLLVLLAYGSRASSQEAVELSLVYYIPAPNAQNISPTTSLAIHQGSPLVANAAEIDLFVVTGSKSGIHSGRAVLSDDQLTLLFYPDEPFEYGETVQVSIRSGLKSADNKPISSASYQFTIIEQPRPQSPELNSWETESLPTIDTARPGGGTYYYTHPEFANIITRTVTTPAQNTDDGYIFIGVLGHIHEGPAAVMIMDDTGEPVYIGLTPDTQFVGDFKKQTVSGVDYLTYHVGILPGGYSNGSSYVLDENYQLVDTWTVGNGYGSDLHEFLLLDNGHAILMAYVPIPFDLTPYGGPPNGTLIDIVLQEQDASKNVVFEWHGSQHMPIEDTQFDLNTTNPIDFLHTNGIDVDDDGHWLISSRNFSEITKINRQTGAIIWRMGGEGNEFTFTNDIGFVNQHNINRIENGNITLFDNGTFHVPPHSRAIEYAIDEVAKTATRVWMYPDDTSEYSAVMSNIQRLPNGNSMIGWGSQPKLTEVQSDGTVALEMLLGVGSYRSFRFPWNGVPAAAPRAVLQYDADPTAVTIYTSWNGATDINSYDIYAGTTIATMAMVDNAPRTGFETQISLTGLPTDTCFFQTKPVHAQGNSTPFSNMTFRLDLPFCWDQLDHSHMPIAAK